MNNTRLGDDHNALIIPPISRHCSNTFLEQSFIYAAPCEWNKVSECIRTSNFVSERVLKQCYLHNNMEVTENNNVCIVHIIVISVVITITYFKYTLLLYSPLNS